MSGLSDHPALSWVQLGWLLLISCFAFLPGIAGIPVTDRDEGRFVQASKQMIETGDYIDIRFQDEPRHKKPVGIYWLQIASVKTTRALVESADLRDVWPYRIPSFLGALTAVLVTGCLGARLAGRSAGFLAALLLVGAIVLQAEARIAKTDAVLLATATTAMLILARAYVGKIGVGAAAIFWIAAAVSVLVKGPLILLLAGGAIGALAWADRNLRWLRRMHVVWGIPLFMLLVLPWLIAIYIVSDGEFYRESLGQDLLGKVFQGQDRGFIPPGAHALLLPVFFWPASLLIAYALPDLRARCREPLIRFLLAWILPFWAVMELSFTKLSHYTLPVYPALGLLAVIAAQGGWDWARQGRFSLLAKHAPRAWWLVALATATATAVVPLLLGLTVSFLQLCGGLALLTGASLSLKWLGRDLGRSITASVYGSVLFAVTTFGFWLPSLEPLWISRHAVDIARREAPGTPRFITVGYREPSIVFLAGTDTIFANNSEHAFDLLPDTPCGVVLERVACENAEETPPRSPDVQVMDSFRGFHYNGGGWQKYVLYRSLTIP